MGVTASAAVAALVIPAVMAAMALKA